MPKNHLVTLVGFAVAIAGTTELSAHSEGPLGLTVHQWNAGPQIARSISTNFDAQGGDDFVSWSTPARITTHQGRKCLTGAYMLFDIDDSFAFDIDETMLVDLTFYRPGTTGFHVSYDEAVAPTAKEVKFAAQAKGSFHTETVRLDRARFANRKLYGTDLGVGALGSTLEHKGDLDVTLCGIRVRREAPAAPRAVTGKFRLKVLDENGRPTAARVGLYRQDGWAPLAGKSALPFDHFTTTTRDLAMVSVPKTWSSKGRYVFFADTHYEGDVPEGNYQLFVMKGPEYALQGRPVHVTRDGGDEITVRLKRWVNLPAQGWFSGDDHIHIARSTPAQNRRILNFMRAEDTHIANLLQMGNLRGSYFKQYQFGAGGQYGDGDYFLVSGQESPRTSNRGHTIGLNGKQFHWPERDYFLYDATADHIHGDGGLWGYAHVALNMFGANFGLALDVPRGKVDFVEMLQWGTMDTHFLYDFLNMGFRLLPSAGSDYPYIDFPGSERIYVHVDGALTPQAWFNGWASGRSYVSNWFSIDSFTMNGDARAAEYDVKRGEPVSVEAKIRANPDFDLLDRIELVAHGKVIESVSSKDGASELSIRHSFAPDASAWVAVRAYGKGRGLLHSAPVYLYVDGERDFSYHKERAGIARKYQAMLQELRQSTPQLEREWERFAVEHLVLSRWTEVKPRLDKMIEEANAVYGKIAATAKR